MRVLVAGGAGFIGSHLCEALHAQGHIVTCADNLITGRRANLAKLERAGGVRFIQHDILQPLNVETDAIFDLASPASPEGYWRHPIETLLVNSQGTLNMLQLAERTGARFLYTSTSEIYGDPLVHPQREDYWGNVNSIGPRSCYDEGKRYSEALTVSFRKARGVNARLVRIFNCYGPYSDPNDGRIVPNFITQALRGEPLTIHGDGSQTRSLCYVSDLVDGLLRAMFHSNTDGLVVNLGNPAEQTVLTYAQVIKRLAGSSSEIVHVEGRTEEIARRCPDITRARERLGWAPEVDLEEGMTRTIAWFREELGLPVR